MRSDGVGQRQRQRVGQLPRPRRLRGIAPLRRRLDAGQLVGGLAPVAGNPCGVPHACHRLAQPAACRHRPPVGQRQTGMHEQEIGRHARPRRGDRVVRIAGLSELGVRLGQREIARRAQTRCDVVYLHPGNRLVHQPGRLGDGAPCQLGVARQQGQVRIRQTRNVAGRVGQLLVPCGQIHRYDRSAGRRARRRPRTRTAYATPETTSSRAAAPARPRRRARRPAPAPPSP